MERYYQVAKVNIKYNLLPHFVIALLLFVGAPAIMGMKNLNVSQTAQVMELYVSIFGIIFMVPLFLPDQDHNIRDLLESKKMTILKIQLIRYFIAVFFLSTFVVAFLLRLKAGGCVFEFSKIYYGSMATCLFLGGLGILIYSLVDNIAVAYMVPILYYILCYGAGDKLGKFYLFTMMKGSFEEKWYLFVYGILMMIVGICYRNIKTIFRCFRSKNVVKCSINKEQK